LFFNFSFDLELAPGDSNQSQGLIARFYGSNENISILASSKSRKKKNSFLIDKKRKFYFSISLQKNIVYKVRLSQVSGFSVSC